MIISFITIRFLDILDILIFSFVLYQIHKLIRGTYAIKIAIGVLAVYLFWYLVKALNMQLLSGILGQFIGVGVIALIIVFQPELRRGFLLLGSRYLTQERFPFLSKLWSGNSKNYSVKIHEIVTACRSMSLTKTGALIIIERQLPLDSFLSIKDILNADTSSSLLESIFFKNSPLHDGAVIINNAKIFAARCVLPLSEKQLPGDFGMRHRAAIGITESTDAVALVVSEETGLISFVTGGEIQVGISTKKLQQELELLFALEEGKNLIENFFAESVKS